MSYSTPSDYRTTPGDGQSSTDQAKDKAQEVAGQAKEQAQHAKEQARSAARTQVDQRSTEAGQRVTGFASDFREVAGTLREQGKDKPAQLATQAADRVERVGDYLTHSDADRILDDIEDFGRRQPWVVIAGGVALGLVASRFLKASSSRRYEQRRSGAPQLPAPSYEVGAGTRGGYGEGGGIGTSGVRSGTTGTGGYGATETGATVAGTRGVAPDTPLVPDDATGSRGTSALDPDLPPSPGTRGSALDPDLPPRGDLASDELDPNRAR